MNISEFVSNVLIQIEDGLNVAEKATGKSYYIQEPYKEKGVSFDIAITSVAIYDSKSEKKGDFSLKSSVLQIAEVDLNGEYEKGSGDKVENSKVSRVQFTVNVPATERYENTEEQHKEKDGGKPLTSGLWDKKF
jgi:hypothetical protein